MAATSTEPRGSPLTPGEEVFIKGYLSGPFLGAGSLTAPRMVLDSYPSQVRRIKGFSISETTTVIPKKNCKAVPDHGEGSTESYLQEH